MTPSATGIWKGSSSSEGGVASVKSRKLSVFKYKLSGNPRSARLARGPTRHRTCDTTSHAQCCTDNVIVSVRDGKGSRIVGLLLAPLRFTQDPVGRVFAGRVHDIAGHRARLMRQYSIRVALEREADSYPCHTLNWCDGPAPFCNTFIWCDATDSGACPVPRCVAQLSDYQIVSLEYGPTGNLFVFCL